MYSQNIKNTIKSLVKNFSENLWERQNIFKVILQHFTSINCMQQVCDYRHSEWVSEKRQGDRVREGRVPGRGWREWRERPSGAGLAGGYKQNQEVKGYTPWRWRSRHSPCNLRGCWPRTWTWRPGPARWSRSRAGTGSPARIQGLQTNHSLFQMYNHT